MITWKDTVPLLAPMIIVGGLVALALWAPKAPELAYAPVEHTGSDIVVESQPSGTLAVIASSHVKAGGFITVHESMSGAPAEIIGYSSLLPPGEHTDVLVRLNRDMLPGYRYIVLMMEDDGDGIYEPGIDRPVMSEGVVIKRDFVTQGGEESVE